MENSMNDLASNIARHKPNITFTGFVERSTQTPDSARAYNKKYWALRGKYTTALIY